MPSNCVPVPSIRAVASMMVGIGRLCRCPIAKSLGSWAGVILTTSNQFGVDVVVGDHRDGAVEERVRQLGAHQVRVPIVVGMHRDRGVTEHRLQPGGGHHDVRLGVVEGAVAEADQFTLDVGVGHLDVADRGLQDR